MGNRYFNEMSTLIDSRSRTCIYLAASLVVFTLFYWSAAYFKPFHVDEFFSWVYAERCTLTEILFLKDFGIGHPPLFHLLQKVVIELFPAFHFLQVRLVNFVVGAIFVSFIVIILSKHGRLGIYPVSIACSASVINLFVFSRMWGLVCLSSLLLLWAGEMYVCTDGARYFAGMVMAFAFGFISDYNFVLMVPYLGFVFGNRRSSLNPYKIMYAVLVPALLLSVLLKAWIDKDARYIFYYFASSITKVIFEAANMMINFWFFEPFMLAVLVLAATAYFFQAKGQQIPTFLGWGKQG